MANTATEADADTGILGRHLGTVNDDFLARAAIAAAFIFLASYTWAHWGDLQIDCGREVYVPAEILKGRMLYRDIWYPYGPLVPYIQALLLWCFGVYFNTFYFFGLSLTLSIAYLAYSLARRLLPPTAAVAVSLGILSQGFSEFIFNYVFPYSYAAVVALVLGLVCIYFLFQYVDTHVDRKLVFASLTGGLALLCKQEFGAAAVVAIGFTMVWDFIENRSFAALFRQALMIAPGLLLAVLVYGWFFWRLTPDFMLRENFSLSPNSAFMKTIGPRWIADHGFRFVSSELGARLMGAGFSLGAWFLGAKLFSDVIPVRWTLGAAATLAVLVLIVASSGSQAAQIPYNLSHMVTFPLGMYWVAPVVLIAAISGLPRSADRATRSKLAILAVFAIVLAMRVMVLIRRSGYSIYYDPPLFMLFMVVVTAAIWSGARRLIRAERVYLLNCFMLVDAVWLLLVPFPFHRYQPVLLETSLGAIFTPPAEAAVVPQMVSFIRTEAQAGKPSLILPEFPMLYVLSRIESPSRWYTLFPGMLDDEAEKQFISDAEARQIEYVIITNRETPDYGYPYFGIDWGQQIYRWVNSNFEQAGEFGKFERRSDAPFGALLYKRKRTSQPPARSAGPPQKPR